MSKNQKPKKLIAMLCIMCMLISMFSSGSVTFAEDESLTKDVNVEENENTEADEEKLADEEELTEGINVDNSQNPFSEDKSTEQDFQDIENTSEYENDFERESVNESQKDLSRPEKKEIIAEKEESQEDITEMPIVSTTEPIKYNTKEIRKQMKQDDVTVEVTAPIGSFPEDTSLSIDPVTKEDNKVGFDITFSDSEGNEIQPLDDCEVDVLFTIGKGSNLLSKDGRKTRISAYHKDNDGTIEQLDSVITVDESVKIKITAFHFSEYGVISEIIDNSFKSAAPATRAADQSSAFHASITSNNDTYESGTTAIVSVKYSLEPGVVAPGDYVIMTIPESIASNASFSLNGQHFSGYEYLGGGQYKLIFGEGVETGLSGSFTAFVTTNAEVTTTDTISVGDGNKEITVVPSGAPSGPGVYTDAIMKDASDNPGVSYGGYDYSDGYGDHAAQIGIVDLTDGGTFKYRLYVNNKEANLSNVTVIDQLPDGMTFNSEKGFEVTDAITGADIDPSLYSIHVSGQTITFSYPGEFNNRIQINYWVDIPAGSNQSKYTNTATITYTQDGNVYQEHRNYVLQGTANSASNGEKSVDKTEISTDPADQFVTYTIKFWNSNGFEAGEINLIDELDSYVRFVSASENEYFSILQDPDNPQKLHITNTSAISESMTAYVRFIVDMSNVPEGYTVENTVGGNTTKTTKDISLQLLATKRVDGNEPGDLRFEFELYQSNGTVLQTKENDSSGIIAFDPMSFSQEDIGIHSYRIREKENPDSPFEQDTSFYYVTIYISRLDTGLLVGDVIYGKNDSTGEPRVVDPENVIFNNTSQTISVEGTKEWIGDNGSVRPESIVVHLFADGEMVDSKTVSSDTGWTYSFDGLPKYSDGMEIQYSVTEEPITGYHSEIDGFDITNTYIPETVEIPVEKQWVGPALDSVTINLLADGEVIESTELNEGNEWQHTFGDLPKYDSADGHEIEYDAEEEAVEGYETGRSGTAETGFTFTNTIAGKVSIPVTKAWIGPVAEEVTVVLLGDGEKVSEAQLNEDNNWQYTFTDLDKYNDGSEIEYTIEEVNVEGYASEISGDQTGFTITNTSTETIEIPVEKQWVGPALDSVTINLLADGEVIESTELNEGNEWQHTFGDLPKYDSADGHEIEYDAEEEAVEGYETGRSGTAETGFTFTNTIAGKVSIPVTKAWIGPVAEEVTVVLLGDGEKVSEAQLNEDNNWQYTFTDLDKYNDGSEIEYTIEEVNVEGYASEISGDQTGFTITNTSTETIEIPVEKQWIGPAAESVTIRLFADGLEQENIVLSEDNDWKYVFTDLDKYDHNDGHEINYNIQEDIIPGYDPKVIDAFEEGVTFINTNVETIDIPVEKKWIGPEQDSVTVNLIADGEEVDSVVLTDEDDWKYTFKGLLRYDGKDGHEIEYTIEELEVDDYETEISGDSNGYTVTNTNTETIDIPVEKKWVGPELDSVTVNLLSDGEVLCDADLNKDNDWQYTFTDLPKYDGTDGHEIDYTISEDSVENYSSEISGNADEGFVVTNTNVETVSVEGIKVWDDNDDQDGIRPESITVRLMANGIEIDNRTVSEDDDWKWSFVDLPKYDNGEEISYDIAEDDVDGYVSEITQDVESQYVITNYHEPGMIDISVNKIWKDYNDKLGKRPDSITIRLLADGESTGDSIILNEDNGWSGSFSYLDKYRDDKLITYSISEDVVKGYTSSIKGSAEDGFTVTNKVITGAPKTGDGTNVIKYFCLILISVMGIICMLAKPKRRKAKVNK